MAQNKNVPVAETLIKAGAIISALDKVCTYMSQYIYVLEHTSQEVQACTITSDNATSS